MKRISVINVLLVAGMAWLALFSHVVPAAPLNYEQAQSIYAVAWGATRHLHDGDRDVLHKPPVVAIVTQADLCSRIRQPANCRALGLYKDQTVFLVASLDFSKVYAASILLHEFVYHIQFLTSGRDVTNCDEWLSREHEAYQIQINALMHADDLFHASQVARSAQSLRCE